MTEGNRKMLKIFSGLGALFACLLIALGFKIYYALATDQPVLRADYYETGRRYDNYVKNNANTKNRKLHSPMFDRVQYPHIPVKGFLRQGKNRLPVRYTNAEGQGVAAAKVQLRLGRRATNREDFATTCTTDATGRCTLQFALPHSGYWEGTLRAEDAKGRFRIRGSFLAEPKP